MNRRCPDGTAARANQSTTRPIDRGFAGADSTSEFAVSSLLSTSDVCLRSAAIPRVAHSAANRPNEIDQIHD